jgi:four helix bundle protein
VNHKELDVWKEAMVLVEMIYSFADQLPDREKFGLTSQIKRAAISIPSNIAEGAARQSDKEFIQYCFISLGSIAEVETQLILSNRLFDLNIVKPLQQIETGKKLTLGLIRYLKSK